MSALKRQKGSTNLGVSCEGPQRSGPLTVYQLVDWPRQLADDLCRDPDAKAVLTQNLAQGLLADDSLHRLVAELVPRLGLDKAEARLRTAYTCDEAEGPKKCCTDGLRPAFHHFDMVEDRLPENMLEEVDGILLTAIEKQISQRMSAREANEACLSEVGQYLMRKWKDVCPRGKMTSACYRHFGRFCSCTLDPTDYNMEETALSIAVAGVVCVGFSQLGGQARLGHVSMKTFHVWAASMRCMAPDVIVAESAPAFDKEVFKWWYEDMYILQFYDHPGPHMLGYPMNRPRVYVTMVRRNKFVTTASFDEYKEMFGRSVVLTGDSYYNAEPEDVLREARHIAHMRKMKLPEMDELPNLDWVRLYPVGLKERYRQYEELRCKVASRPAFIADLEQNESFGPQAGHFLPTLVTHGCVHSWARKRCLIPEEHLAAQGVQLYFVPGWHDPAHRSIMQPLLEKRAFTRNEMKQLAGNGMHQPTVASIVMYTLATMHRYRSGVPPQIQEEGTNLHGESGQGKDDGGRPAPALPRRMSSVLSDGCCLDVDSQ